MKKYYRYIIIGLGVLAGVLLFVYITAYTYIAFNKESIIQKIRDQVAAKLNGDVQIGDISLGFFSTFPHISVLLENVSVKDTLFSQHHHPFFQGEKIYLNLSVVNIILKKNPVNGIRADKGQLYVYTDTSGYTNAYLFSPKKDQKTTSQNGSDNDIENIRLRNVRLILNNRKKNKLYDFDVTRFTCDIKKTGAALRLKSKNNILIHSLAFNTNKGSFVKESAFEGNLNLFYNTIKKQLTFDDLDISIKNHPFKISGAFNFAQHQTFSFKVATKSIDYDFARSLLTEKNAKALSVVKIEKPLNNVSAEISGLLAGADPLVKASWNCSNTNIQSAFASFTNCSFNGTYTNELVAGQPRLDPNSRLHFENFNAAWEGLAVHSQNIYIDNLKVPMVTADIKSDFDLTRFNNVLESSTLDFHQGKAQLDITYNGPLQENNKKNTILNGKCTFSDGIIMYHPRNIEVKNLSGNVVFKNSDLLVNDFRGDVQGNKIIMNGSGKDLLALMKTNPGKMFIDWNIYSPALNLGSFTSLLQKRVATVKKKKLKFKIGNNIDEIVSQANFHLNLKADQLIYKRFIGTNVKASVGLVNENWILNNVNLNHGGGSMVISGSLNEKNSNYFESNIKVNIQNADVTKVFYAFDNFGQKGITSENLRGKLTSIIDVKMDIDRNLAGTPKNLDGFIDFSLKNGALLHYEPLQKVQEIVFKKRNFDEIYFAELKDRFDIRDGQIVINRMEIESSVLTLFVAGTYGMKGNSDISIQVPLSNLKKRSDDTKPENKGADAKGGASIFIRGQPGDDGNMKFKLDLFKKFRKKGAKESSADVFKE